MISSPMSGSISPGAGPSSPARSPTTTCRTTTRGLFDTVALLVIPRPTISVYGSRDYGAWAIGGSSATMSAPRRAADSALAAMPCSARPSWPRSLRLARQLRVAQRPQRRPHQQARRRRRHGRLQQSDADARLDGRRAARLRDGERLVVVRRCIPITGRPVAVELSVAGYPELDPPTATASCESAAGVYTEGAACDLTANILVSTPSGARATTLQVAANLIWSPVKDFDIGLETRISALSPRRSRTRARRLRRAGAAGPHRGWLHRPPPARADVLI